MAFQTQPSSTGGNYGFFSGTTAKHTQIPKFNQQQQSALAQLLQRGLSGLQNPQQGFEPIAQKARTQFNTQTAPGLAERFTSMGGGQRSGAFQSAVGSAGQGLEESLAALGAQYGLQSRGLDQNLLGLGLGEQNQNIYEPEKQSDFMSILMALIGAGGQLGGAYLGMQK